MLTVMIIQHIVSPARNLKTDEMFADVEIQRYDRVIGEQHARDGNATAAVMSLVDARKAILGKSGPRELWLDDLIRKRLTTLEYGETAR